MSLKSMLIFLGFCIVLIGAPTGIWVLGISSGVKSAVPGSSTSRLASEQRRWAYP